MPRRRIARDLAVWFLCLHASFAFVLSLTLEIVRWESRRSISQTDSETSPIDLGRLDEIPGPHLVEITGANYRWRVQYQGFDKLRMTSGDRFGVPYIHLPINADIRLVLKSDDFVYSFAIPDLQIREIAVPGLEFAVNIHAAVAGNYALDGDEFCGDPHPELDGLVVVETRQQFREWLSQQTSETPDSDVLSPPSVPSRRLR